MNTFAVLQLSGCAGCEVGLLDADAWPDLFELAYMPLVSSSYDVPEVDILLVSGGLRTEEDLYRLRRSVRRAKQVIAVGTCSISGGIASLGDRDEIRSLFIAEENRHHVPHLLPKCRPVDRFVEIDRYLPGCPPTPELFMAALSGSKDLKTNRIVCTECGRKKDKKLRPTKIVGFRQGEVLSDICLINQGFLCIGSSTRNGCGAVCPKAGFPCVGCRGPSNAVIEKESTEWLNSIVRVFSALTDIPPAALRSGLLSPQMSLFLFQFTDYAGKARPPRPKEKML
jgi:F420-non-reducing hydrogenase small subunit